MDVRRVFLLLTLLALLAQHARAQSFGVEAFNNLMPASGGMAGASIALPQDLQSAIYGNPATLTQYRGFQFGLGGAWIEPTYDLSVGDPGLPLLGIQPFPTAKSDAQGIAAPNIGVTQDFSVWGLPVTTGLGLLSGSGAAADFRHIPQADGTHVSFIALDIVAGAGVDLSDRLSLGAALILSNATLDGPFVGNTSSSTDYALRGSLGLDYALTTDTTVGLCWKSEAGYTFQNVANFPAFAPGVFLDVAVDRPQSLGFGIANQRFLDGQLLLALDAVYQRYEDTEVFGQVFQDQWAVQLGTQLAITERVRLRAGYAWNENPMRDSVGDRIGGIAPPGAADHVRYIQALFAAIPQHRITGGVGIRDVLPGVDLDIFAGGMFEASQTFGITTASVESYWIGTGITWRFGCGEGDS